MNGDGAWLASMTALDIEDRGVSVYQADGVTRLTLPGGTTPAKAMYLTTGRDIAKYAKEDGEEAAKLVSVLVFPGSMQGTLIQGTRLVAAGILVRVDTLHPRIVNDVCVAFAVACVKG